MYIVLSVDKSKLKPEQAKDAADRVVEVIRNRVDQLGVFEPVIQKVGEDRIIVQLPGVVSKERARMIIGKTALLEFKLLADEKMFVDFIREVDRVLKGEKITGIFKREDTTKLSGPFSKLLVNLQGDVAVLEENWKKVDSILKLPEVKNLIPAGYEILWGATKEIKGRKFRKLFMVRSETPLTGAYLVDARATIGQQQAAGQPVVQLRFDRTGAAIFARITGENVGKRLAIVLDGVVQSAPRIQERIPTGNAQISDEYAVYADTIHAITLNGYKTIHPLKKRAKEVQITIEKQLTTDYIWNATGVMLDDILQKPITWLHADTALTTKQSWKKKICTARELQVLAHDLL